MNTNEKLTEAARRGAQGHTSGGASVYASLPQEQQRALLDHIIAQPKLTEEIVISAINAMPRDEIEDLLNELGETSAPEGKTFHAGTDDTNFAD